LRQSLVEIADDAAEQHESLRVQEISSLSVVPTYLESHARSVHP